MKKIIMLLLGMFLMFGCASGKLWYKNGATQQSFNKDKMECQYQGKLATAGRDNISSYGIASGIGTGLERLELFKMCMKLKGYELR